MDKDDLHYISDTLGEMNCKLSNSLLISIFQEFVEDNDIDLNITEIRQDCSNKRSFIFKILSSISDDLQIKLIKKICMNRSVESDPNVKQIQERYLINTNASIIINESRPCKIFISHKSEDSEYANAIRLLLSQYGFNDEEEIFISSIPGNGVDEHIRTEIKEALKSSKLDIILLSKEYYKSVFCLNEMGSIWFKDGNNVLLIATDSIEHEEIIGFLSPDHMYRRVEDSGDRSLIIDTIVETFNIEKPNASKSLKDMEFLKNCWENAKRNRKKSIEEVNTPLLESSLKTIDFSKCIFGDDEISIKYNGVEIKTSCNEFLKEFGESLLEGAPRNILLDDINYFIKTKKKISDRGLAKNLAKEMYDLLTKHLFSIGIIENYSEDYLYQISEDETITVDNELFWIFTEQGKTEYRKCMILKKQ